GRDDPPIVAVVGPTAAGKSSLGMELARRLGGEIINGDALQVYRRLEIGTDKPTPAMRAEIPHHLVDILEPEEPFSAGDFARLARGAIDEVRSRGRLPIVVGGSGLYGRALFQGLSPLPQRDPEVRRQLDARLQREGLAALRAELERLDPETAARLHPNDTQRISRALEVRLSSGVPMSEWWKKRPREPQLRPLRIGLTLPRAILYDRIAGRVVSMVERGWVNEVSELLEHGIHPFAPAFQAIGYRQLVRHLQGTYDLGTALEETIRATRRYAKRQLTWYKREPDVRWISGLELEAVFPSLLHEIQIRGALAR
ncbi:MAG: tRNA (adenosine(37)-N6)-dimethylallyltransferase MiaA, partial [Holophagales bacterium]|nr:tRNA (adenosine(37)-N6)-dimethylallyltransferase MiaA [Holophagales bacterium]